MKLDDIKEGMKLVAVGDYADCIKTGDTFDVTKHPDGELIIKCRGATHTLDEEMVCGTTGDIPELELER